MALMARAQCARFAWSSDRETLGAAYVLALEAMHRATEGDCLRYACNVSDAVFAALEAVLDRGRLSDIDGELALARGLAERLDEEWYFLLARIATALNRRAAVTRSRDDVLAMAETGARAAELGPARCDPIRELRIAAQGRSFLGRNERAAAHAEPGVWETSYASKILPKPWS